jgi:CRP-like cAMP-binding protein
VRLGKNAKVELIRSVPLFAACTAGELSEIAALADEVDVAAGKEFIREGELGHEFFVLVEGSADVLRDGRRIDTLRAGEFAGEMALLTQRPRNATVRATAPVRALVLSEAAFRKLLKDSPRIQLKVLQTLAERVPDRY